MRVNQTYQMPLPNFDPLIKLETVEAVLAKIFQPVPSRPTLYAWLEDGTLEGRQMGRGNNWYVYTSSLNEFILRIQAPRQTRLAA